MSDAAIIIGSFMIGILCLGVANLNDRVKELEERIDDLEGGMGQ